MPAGDSSDAVNHRSRRLWPFFVAALLAPLMSGRLHGDEPASGTAEASDRDHREDSFSERLRHAAESFEWSDELVRHEWRVQRRPGSDASRLLDPADRVILQGTAAACRERFAALESSGQIPPVDGPAVILLHGLGEGRGSMRPLATYLREHNDATVMTFGYASPRAGVDDHARALGDVIAGLRQADRISLVGHSLGNIVVRRWMADAPAADLEKIERMVMLGAPNQGSDLARRVSQVWLLSKLSTGAAKDLVLDWPRIARTIVVPPCPFGIIAGGTGDTQGYSPLLEGDDDAVVRVEETKLDGADDFLLLPVRHAFMMRDPAVQRATAAFLREGSFGAAAAGASPPTAERR
jgi:pimeloyl-ACP methyl ester carboxylesterase